MRNKITVKVHLIGNAVCWPEKIQYLPPGKSVPPAMLVPYLFFTAQICPLGSPEVAPNLNMPSWSPFFLFTSQGKSAPLSWPKHTEVSRPCIDVIKEVGPHPFSTAQTCHRSLLEGGPWNGQAIRGHLPLRREGGGLSPWWKIGSQCIGLR